MFPDLCLFSAFSMETLTQAFQILLPLVYAGLVAYFGRSFFRSGNAEWRLKFAVPAAYLALLLHGIYIGAYTALNHHDLVATVSELSSLIAFTLFAVYVFAELRPSKETSGTGFFVTAVSFLLQTISSFTIGSVTMPVTKAILQDPIFNAHVTTSVFGYAALILAAIYGGLYLLLYRVIQRNEFGAIFEHIPSLERLERFGLRSTAVGFFFLTISIVLGGRLYHTYAPEAGVLQLLADPKVMMTLLVWFVFGVTLLAGRVMHVEGRRLVLFWMSGFALTVVSMMIVNAIGTQFHSFL